MKKLFFKVILYPLLGLFATIFFAFLLLPTDTLSQMLVQRIENGLDNKYHVQIESLDLSFFGTVTLEKVQFTPRLSSSSEATDLFERIDADRRSPSASSSADDDAPAAEAPKEHRDDRCPIDLTAASLIKSRPTFIKKIEIAPSISQFLGGGLDTPLTIQMAGGSADLHIVHHPDHGTKVSGDISNIKLQQFHLLSQMALEKMPMFKLRGIAANFNATLDLGAAKGTAFDSGSISLNISDLALCLPELQMKGSPPIPLPDLRLGDMSGTIELAKDKRITFKDLASDGEDGSLQVSGFIDLASPPRRPKTNWNLTIKLRFSDAYLEAGDLSGLDNICPPNAQGFREIIIRGVEGERGFQSGCNKKPSNAPERVKPPKDDADDTNPTSGIPQPPKPPNTPKTPLPDPISEPTPEPTPEPAEQPMAAPVNPDLLNARIGSNPVAVPAHKSRQMLNAIKGGPKAAASPTDLDPNQRAKMRKAINSGTIQPDASSLSEKHQQSQNKPE